jgi:hypothetical protein
MHTFVYWVNNSPPAFFATEQAGGSGLAQCITVPGVRPERFLFHGDGKDQFIQKWFRTGI